MTQMARSSSGPRLYNLLQDGKRQSAQHSQFGPHVTRLLPWYGMPVKNSNNIWGKLDAVRGGL